MHPHDNNLLTKGLLSLLTTGDEESQKRRRNSWKSKFLNSCQVLVLVLFRYAGSWRKAGEVVNLLINEAVEQALLLTQPSGLILRDLGKLHKQSWMLPTTFRLLKVVLRIQACLNLLDGSYCYSSS